MTSSFVAVFREELAVDGDGIGRLHDGFRAPRRSPGFSVPDRQPSSFMIVMMNAA